MDYIKKITNFEKSKAMNDGMHHRMHGQYCPTKLFYVNKIKIEMFLQELCPYINLKRITLLRIF